MIVILPQHALLQRFFQPLQKENHDNCELVHTGRLPIASGHDCTGQSGFIPRCGQENAIRQ